MNWPWTLDNVAYFAVVSPLSGKASRDLSMMALAVACSLCWCYKLFMMNVLTYFSSRKNWNIW